ncbi:hypothetical protein [Streptomyces sp. NPDC096339]|uniref:hypothetical protein n=1 Tax=Streptomyces sp. NPDC096339 TaxID=3366086 RepID=UPI00381693AD
MNFENTRRIVRGAVVTGIIAASTAFGAFAAHADTAAGSTTPATTQNTAVHSAQDDLGWQ